MSERLVIGVQGATREAVVAAARLDGEILRVHRTGPLALRINRDLRGDFIDALRVLTADLGWSSVRQLISHIAGACIAMSGVFQEGEEFAVQQLLFHTGFVGQFPIVICEDVWADLAAAGLDEGAVLLASTGTNVFVRNAKGDFINAGGWGSELDDLGSGFFIGRTALGRILQSIDGRGTVSEEFASCILRRLQLRNSEQLISWYHAVRQTDYWRAKISDLAIDVVALGEHDSTAADILKDGAREFCRSVNAGLIRAAERKLLSNQSVFPIVLAGALLRNCPLYEQAVRDELDRLHRNELRAYLAPTCSISRSACHPVIGALAFAMNGQRTVPENTRMRTLVDSARLHDLVFEAT